MPSVTRKPCPSQGWSLSRNPGAGGPAALPADPPRDGRGLLPSAASPGGSCCPRACVRSAGPAPCPGQEGKCRFLVRLTSPKEGSQRPWQARLLSASVLSWQTQNRLRKTGGGLVAPHGASQSEVLRGTQGRLWVLCSASSADTPPTPSWKHLWLRGAPAAGPQLELSPPASASAAQPEGPWVLLFE